MQRKHLLIGALVALPLLVGGGAAAFAASGGTAGTSPAATFLADVASQLGIQTSTLQSAMKQAELDQVQQALTAGKITQTEATRIESRINAGDLRPFWMRRPGGPRRMGLRTAMQAAAAYLGQTPQQLITARLGGTSLSAIASSTSGKSVSGLEAAVTSAMRHHLAPSWTGSSALTSVSMATAPSSHLSQNPRGDAGHQGCRRHISSHDCSRRDDGTGPDSDAGQDRGGSSDPDIRTDGDGRSGDVIAPPVWLDGVSRGDQVDLVGEHHVIADIDGGVTGERAL